MTRVRLAYTALGISIGMVLSGWILYAVGAVR